MFPYFLALCSQDKQKETAKNEFKRTDIAILQFLCEMYVSPGVQERCHPDILTTVEALVSFSYELT